MLSARTARGYSVWDLACAVMTRIQWLSGRHREGFSSHTQVRLSPLTFPSPLHSSHFPLTPSLLSLSPHPFTPLTFPSPLHSPHFPLTPSLTSLSPHPFTPLTFPSPLHSPHFPLTPSLLSLSPHTSVTKGRHAGAFPAFCTACS